MKHTEEELRAFEGELMVAVERILTLIDGESDGSTDGIDEVDAATYQRQMELLVADIYDFLVKHPDLDFGYRMELVNILTWLVISLPITDKDREGDLRGYAIGLANLISREAFDEKVQRDYWKVNNGNLPRGESERRQVA